MGSKRVILGAMLLLGLCFCLPKSVHAADWVNIGFADKNIRAVMTDRTDRNHILVSLSNTTDGKYNYYTTDGGTTWTTFAPAGDYCDSFAQSPKIPTEIWAGCSDAVFAL